MTRRIDVVCGILLALLSLIVLRPAVAAPPTAEQKAQVRTAEAAIRKAGNFYRAKRFREAGRAASEAADELGKLAAADSKELAALLAPLERQLDKARELLAAEGVVVSTGRMAGGDSVEAVSFRRQVAPLLVAKCGGCHVQRARGDFSMATYTALIKGSPAGVVVMAGDASGSRMIELIESGDMPRGGNPLTEGEKMLLADWINGGAKFDGDDAGTSLATLASSAMPEMMDEMVPLKAAGEDDAVLFARDVGPVLLAQCIECHGERNPRANFSVLTFNQLLRGGDSGAVLAPGKPDESLLLKKLRGMAGQRMPAGRDPLPEPTIALIAQWIELGAKFDGTDPAMTLPDTVARLAAQRMTHEDLAKRRIERADAIWRLVLPDVPPNHEQSKNTLVVGVPGTAILSSIAKTAEEQVGKLQKQLGLAESEPLIKGRLMLFVFAKRYEYGEMGTMLEKRELPPQWRGHWSYNALDAYGCLLLSDGQEASPGLVTQQMAGAYVASLGDVPRWFSEGSARAMAARLDPKDERVRQWDDRVAEVLATTKNPEYFLTGALPAEDADLLSYSFVKSLMAPMPKYRAMLKSLRDGVPFGQAFEKAFRTTPEKLVPEWIARGSKRR